MKDVFFLGAGFSKAVCETMPTLVDLNKALSELRDHRWIGDVIKRTENIYSDNFELRLGYLAQSPLWFREEDGLRNRADFLELSRIVCNILNDRTEKTIQQLKKSTPEWLKAIVSNWHYSFADIISTNYDTIIEHIACDLKCQEAEARNLTASDLYPISLIDFRRKHEMMFGLKKVDTLKLFKLHGSINWFYSGKLPFFGEDILFSPIQGLSQAIDENEKDLKLERHLREKEPLIVPPLTDKNLYFQHNSMHHLWFWANEAISTADRVFCLGYSFPESDLMLRHFFNVRHSKESIPKIYIVNKDENTEAHYRKMLPSIEPANIQQLYKGDNSISDFCKWYCEKESQPKKT